MRQALRRCRFGSEFGHIAEPEYLFLGRATFSPSRRAPPNAASWLVRAA